MQVATVEGVGAVLRFPRKAGGINHFERSRPREDSIAEFRVERIDVFHINVLEA